MATSPTSQSALTSGAAKDDAVGVNGDYTFTIADLLANDPGGAAKVDVTKQFFFGDTAADQADQAGYLAKHGITDNHDGTYTINAEALDSFSYFVQIGNKGTWSQADVAVTAPEPEPEAVPHTGGNLFSENFDETPLTVYGAPSGPVASGSIDLVAKGWTGTDYNNTGSLSEVAMSNMFGPTEATSGTQFLDTQNTPGQINISHTFTDNTAAINGKTATLSFDIGKFDIDWGGGYQTNSNEKFEFRIDDQKVAEFTASQFDDALLHHFDINISDYADNADSVHTLSLVNTSDASSTIGFAVDSIQINDWIV